MTLAVQEIARLAAAGHLAPAEVTPELIAAHLATRQLPPAWQQPDLVVRARRMHRLTATTRADRALYRSKNEGRNRVTVDAARAVAA